MQNLFYKMHLDKFIALKFAQFNKVHHVYIV